MEYNSRGLVFAFEGLDGSGKETQTLLLEKRLKGRGLKVLRIEFPSYDTDYSMFVRKYLSGEFKGDIDPYVVAMFFSLDRFGIYNTLMDDYLSKGYIILCDRYVYSNLIYQGSKIGNVQHREKFFKWVLDFEHGMCGLPKADITFFMDIPIDISLGFIRERSRRDMYESDEAFLKKCYENCNNLVHRYNLVRVNCFSNDVLLSVSEINDFIYHEVLKVLKTQNLCLE